MQRDVGNEVVVAIVAVGVLAFVIMFAVILSLSGAGQGDLTPTQQAGVATTRPSVESVVTTPEIVASPTATTVPPSLMPSSVPASAIPTQALTVTPVLPSFTTTPIPTTIVPTQKATNPVIVPTTPQIKPTTPAPTNTIHPSNTPTPTMTPSATPTPTYTKTATAEPTHTPTATATRTPRPTDKPTRTPRPTETSGIRPTPTGTRTTIPPVLDLTCTPQAGWYSYTVRQGETLSMIARAVGASIGTLQRANCLQDVNQIYAGQNILVPRLPVESPSLPGATPGSDLSIEGCTAPGTQITNLNPGQLISGTFSVRGTASAPNFQYYKIEVRPDFASIFNFYSRSETPVENGILTTIDSAIFGRGLHWIKLTVISDVDLTPCVIPVIFQ